MTAEADRMRNRRRAFAAPGGSHDRLIGFLSRWLPGAIGVLAAVMILAPLSPRGDVSFLLDRNKVAITQERLRVEKAQYRGVDNKDQPFSLTAGNAVQKTATVPVVEMNDLVARMLLTDGPAVLSAPGGAYNYSTEQVMVRGDVNFAASDGYRMVTRNVTIDMKNNRMNGSGGVEGAIPAGVFNADSIQADLNERTVALQGRARLRMEPGKLKMPK
jgi:lipopolysaccharide export system protein LptC